MKFHAVFVIEVAHDFNFFDEAFFAFVFAVGCFFGEGFDGKASSSLYFFSEVDRGEVPFSYFLFGFELFVEAALVEFALENFAPGLEFAVSAK